MVAAAEGGLRSARERVVQTLWFEGLGLLLIAPLVALAAGTGLQDSFVLVTVLSVVVMAWSAVFNTMFDIVERRRTGRVASDRPHAVRTLHALLHEATAVVVSCPVIVAMTTLSWGEALLADLGLTLAYAAYAYLFHLAYDRLRPVRAGSAAANGDPAGGQAAAADARPAHAMAAASGALPARVR